MSTAIWTIIGIIIVAVVIYFLVKGKGKKGKASPAAPSSGPEAPEGQ